jgi:hypothetical protein
MAADPWEIDRLGYLGRLGIAAHEPSRAVPPSWKGPLRNLLSLNKFEMLPWDVWGSQPAPDEVLDDQRLLFFDELAAFTRDPDTSFEQLLQRYASDERVRVPVTVFNALRRQHEAVETHT